MKKVAFILLLSVLLLCGCAHGPGALRQAFDPLGQAEDKDGQKEDKTSPGASELPALPPRGSAKTPAMPEDTPADTMEPEMVQALLKFEKEEMEYFKTLWPLEKYSMGDMGQFYDIFVYMQGDYFSITYAFKSGKKFKDIKKEMQKYIKGEWEDSDNSSCCDEGEAEGVSTSCGLYEEDDHVVVSLTFSLSGGFSRAVEILDSHWPQGAITTPEMLAGKPDSRCVGIDAETVYFSYKWYNPKYREAFGWFRENMKGQDDYIYSDRDEYDDEIVRFFIGDIHVTIGVSDEYRTVSLTYFFCADSEALFYSCGVSAIDSRGVIYENE